MNGYQPPLPFFDAPPVDRSAGIRDGTMLRDAAILATQNHAAIDWQEAALNAVLHCAHDNRTLIVDDVWLYLDSEKYQTPEARAMGSVMLQAKSLKWIEATPEFQTSHVAAHHANPRRVWRSLVYVEKR